jgi:hypothetical protein
MNPFLKVTIAVVLIGFLAWALLSILASLESTMSTDPFSRVADPDDSEADYDGLPISVDLRQSD